MSRLGFSTDTSSSGQDFLPFIKYDARAGVFKRVDRVFDGQNWFSEDTIIPTEQFCALFDLENAETGQMDFGSGMPSMVLVKMADIVNGAATVPVQPTPKHKPGVRLLLKLHPSIAGERPLREIASNAKTFCRAIDLLDQQYLQQRDANPGMLPVVRLSGPPLMVKTGSGAKSSTNFQPQFVIIAWAPRGDLIWRPHSKAVPQQQTAPQQQQVAQQAFAQQYPQRPSHIQNTQALTGGPNGNAHLPPQQAQYTPTQQGVLGQTPLPWNSAGTSTWDGAGPFTGAPATGNSRAAPPPQQQQPQQQQPRSQTYSPGDFG